MWQIARCQGSHSLPSVPFPSPFPLFDCLAKGEWPLDTNGAAIDDENDAGDSKSEAELDDGGEVAEKGRIIFFFGPVAVAAEETALAVENFVLGAFHAATSRTLNGEETKWGDCRKRLP